ncbi:hypothetical protein [Kaistella rhinocerotis]|nr:hypothetical protein [Kaistella sp. Ran72]
MIPKKIHYCWFGGQHKHELAEHCIASWKRIHPDFARLLNGTTATNQP